MKNIAIIIGAGVLAACASSHGWDDMTAEEESRWKSINVSESQAQEYQDNGLTATDIVSWRQQGFVEPDDILTWSKSRFNAIEAAIWRNQGFDLESALAWSEENFTAEQAQNWKQKGFSLDDAMEERAKGLTPKT
ncbi:hypothetical protein OE749_16935 [Aestuariibacter sp. AA17]|uniref:Lipoprotein n=1 Tax=Fluctibacter corallii TaxID=2984329 RepID=A0ABT3ACJ9_9ALTE|nr:hypothetical protein [Aestuariibacter sp. AA17]MCV2886383.1 hypothetical protein [Aestuariibacter sp. AA17]